MTGTTFRTNSVLLPEYITTIVISLLTSLVVMSDRELLVLRDNPHYAIASALFVAVVLVLVWLTLRARWRWCTIHIDDETVRGSLFGVSKFELWLASVISIREEAFRLYGRRARRLTLRSTRHDPIEVADLIYGYERLKALLVERTGRTVERLASQDETMEKLHVRAAKREAVFGRPRPWRALLFLPARAIGLLPVWFIDLVFALVVVFAFRGDSDVPDPRAVYSAPIALAAAGMAARFIYYRISSSIRLNRVVRFRWGRRGAVNAGA